MALAQEDLIAIEALIDQRLAARPELQNTRVHYELELRERTVRVEEELKHQRELMREGFEQVDKRFEAMQTSMDKRFEQVDKRFETMRVERALCERPTPSLALRSFIMFQA